jgi:phage repressor protein C with HTH and peptisase S24 domain
VLSRLRRTLALWGVAVVRGRSMLPTLHDGDRLLVRHGATPRVGDLAVVRLPDGVVAVKRVTMRQRDGWWVERDNPAEGVDSWLVGAVPDERVVAVVRARLWPQRRSRLRRVPGVRQGRREGRREGRR